MRNGLRSRLLRLCQRTLLLISALLSVETASSEPVGEPVPHPLQVRLEVGSDAFVDGEVVTVRILIENDKTPCAGTLIDTVLVSQSWGYRPFLLVDLEVRDAKGQRVSPGEPLLKQMVGASAGEFLRLDCGEVFGAYLRISNSPASDWNFSFAPGTYRLRASVRSRMRSFVRDTPGMMKEIERAFGVRERNVLRWLRDEVLQSNEVVIEIRQGSMQKPDDKAGPPTGQP
jgi:hypothetical protein